MSSLIDALKTMTKRGAATTRSTKRRNNRKALRIESLEKRALLAAAIMDGAWSNPATWEGGAVPDENTPAVIGQGFTVELDAADHVAKEVVIQGNLVVPEDASHPDKSLSADWIHVNSGGAFIVGSEADRYDIGTFTLELTGTDVESDHMISTAMGEMNVMNNDGFLMTGMGGRLQFYGQDKLSFTKLAATVEAGSDEIIVEKVIERNYDQGASTGDGFVTSAEDDGQVNWEVGDQIVIASSSYDYTEEDVRTIIAIDLNQSDSTAKITLNEPLDHGHYGEIEFYGDPANAAPGSIPASQTYEIDMRAEVALLSRNVKIQSPQGEDSQDTDIEFGDRKRVVLEPRFQGEAGNAIPSKNVSREQALAAGLSHAEAMKLPDTRVANGVGGHIMIMPMSGPIKIDGVQMDGLGQTSQKGRYPIHWHLGDDRSGDVLKNSSVTNSNNRGVTIHGTSNLLIEGVVLHDIHGHGFFFEDAVETGNVLVGNIALGIHTVGGNDKDFANPAGKDPFVVDTHDSVTESNSRFESSAAFWITNPTNTFVGNIAAGAGDARTEQWAGAPGPSGTGFWYALPRTVLGASGEKAIYDNIIPVHAEFGQFDYNTSHSTAVGLNFDRGEDIEDANFAGELRTNGNANNYAPRTNASDPNTSTTNVIYGFTNYKASDAGVYHRGQGETILFDGLRIADSYNAVWSVSENKYDNSLFVGHSQGNADENALVGGPRLYDGSGLYTNTHFAGFEGDNAYIFQVEGSSFGPTMYHAFRGTSFEDDGTFDQIAHAVSDFSRGAKGEYRINHDLGQPHQWSKASIDLDGTLTGGAGGGIGYSIVPNVDFLVEDTDLQPAGWNAWLSDAIYTRVKVGNANSGIDLFAGNVLREPVIRFTARDGDVIDATSGQATGNAAWIQVGAKTDGDGFVEGTFEVEFMQNGLPETVFDLSTNNQDGNRPALSPEIQAKADAARIVVKLVGASNFTPNLGAEVFSDHELRTATSGVVYFRDGQGNLYFNSGIKDTQPAIRLTPGAPLQTTFESRPALSRTIEYGTTIQAEQFDNGIDGIAYHDTDATNTLGSFRTNTGVDATSTTVGNIADGEWLEYTTAITGNAYNVGIKVSSTRPGGKIHLLAGLSSSAGYLRDFGTVDVPNTGGQFETVWLEGVDLTFAEGDSSVIRLAFEGGDFQGVQIDSLEFAPATQTSYVADRTIAADFATTRIELEEYDVGGQGAAYFDDTPEVIDAQSEEAFNIAGNDSSDTFRTDEDVDANESLLTGKVFDGEWLEYTTDIQAGEYDITLEKVWGGDSNAVKLFIANNNAATEFTQLGEFDFQTGGRESSTLSGIDLTPWAGSDRVIRVEIVGNWMGLDYLDFANTAGPSQTAYVARTIAADSTTRIELEEFDLGGQDIAYFDTTTGNNASDSFRTDEDVDSNGSILTNDVLDGEWLEYTTDIAAGAYDITLGLAWSAGDAAVMLLVGESNSATEFTALGEFAFGSSGGETITIENIDLTPWAGEKRMIRIEVVGSWMGLDYLDFAPSSPDQTAPTADIVDVSPDPRNTDAGVVTINFDEDVTGVDINALTLTRDGHPVDISGSTLTQVSPSQYTVDLSTATAVDGNYELSLGSSGSGIEDLAGNTLATDAIDQFMIDMTGPQVESVVLNDGDAQRSMVREITVTFSEEVNGVDASSFILMNTTTGTQIVPIVTTQLVDGKTIATLTFSGAGIIGGSLADGNYSLTTLSSVVTDAAGNQLDGDGDGIAGDDATDTFFRLFGDANGDRRVNIVDFFEFLRALRRRDSGAFDFDGDGVVNILDYFQFRSRFGQSL